MKKLLTVMLMMALSLSLVACGGGNDSKEANPKESEYQEIESCAKYAVGKLKDTLENPDSLVVEDLSGAESEGTYFFTMGYRAEDEYGELYSGVFALNVYPIENGFAMKTYGYGEYWESDNLYYTTQLQLEAGEKNGDYYFDPETLLVDMYMKPASQDEE